MRRASWILLAILLALVGLLLYLNRARDIEVLAEATPTDAVDYLFEDSDGLPVGITVEGQDAGRVSIVRAESGEWRLEAPDRAAADQIAAEAAASQVAALRIVARPEVPFADAGLDPARYSAVLALSGGVQEVVRIGDLTPTGKGYYANLAGEPGVLILDKAGVDALLSLLGAPPYSETPTPSPLPELPTATPEGLTGTPDP